MSETTEAEAPEFDLPELTRDQEVWGGKGRAAGSRIASGADDLQRSMDTLNGFRGSEPGPSSRWSDGGGGRGVAEFGDLASVRRFAEQVCALGEGSDFVQVIKACGGLKDMMRDLGGDVNREVAAFMDAAVAVARDGEELKEQAAMVARLATDLSGA